MVTETPLYEHFHIYMKHPVCLCVYIYILVQYNRARRMDLYMCVCVYVYVYWYSTAEPEEWLCVAVLSYIDMIKHR